MNVSVGAVLLGGARRRTAPAPARRFGPKPGYALPWPDGQYIVPIGTPDAVWLTGIVRDARGRPVPDALIETWQADPDGHFDRPDDPSGSSFRGFGRAVTDESGRYEILTLKPGPVPAVDGRLEAPHVEFSLFARTLPRRLVTRAYFDDESPTNATDPVLSLLGVRKGRSLVAQTSADGYRFDICIGGETVFFDI